jgi:predicted dehydrogenase
VCTRDNPHQTGDRTVTVSLKKFAVVGMGNRGLGAFAKGILGFPGKGLPEFKKYARLVAICDANSVRVKVARDELKTDVATYTDYGAMLKEADFDILVVATPDRTHADVAVKAFEAGKNVVCEKPLATSVADCDRMIAAAEANGRWLRAAQNMRYGPYWQKLKAMIADGAIGNLKLVTFEEQLDTSHGADYFRRWHRDKRNSGGLLLHKASHHFDWLNWAIDGHVSRVSAFGDTCFYVPREKRGTCCRTCDYTAECPFYFDVTAIWDGLYKRMYVDGEQEDNYVRDGCVWDPEINIEDRVAMIAEYDNGVKLNYTLSCFNPYETVRASFIGDAGRIDAPGDRHIHYYPMHKREKHVIEILPGVGGHGGSDTAILKSIIMEQDDLPSAPADGYQARHAILVGSMANKAIAEKRVVTAEEFGGRPKRPGVRSTV